MPEPPALAGRFAQNAIKVFLDYGTVKGSEPGWEEGLWTLAKAYLSEDVQARVERLYDRFIKASLRGPAIALLEKYEQAMGALLSPGGMPVTIRSWIPA